jgi:hypothetical protein
MLRQLALEGSNYSLRLVYSALNRRNRANCIFPYPKARISAIGGLAWQLLFSEPDLIQHIC